MALKIFISLRDCFTGTCITRVQNDIKISNISLINKETVFQSRRRTQVENQGVRNCIGRKVSIVKCVEAKR